MADYDNTNSVIVFPSEGLRFGAIIGEGNVQFSNNESDKKRVIVTEDTTKSGKTVRRVYMEVGVLFDVESTHEKAPTWSGPVEFPTVPENQISLWLRSGAKGDFMSGKISVRDQNGGGAKQSASASFGKKATKPAPADLDDEIPF